MALTVATRRDHWPAAGLGAAIALMTAAVLVPPLSGWDVRTGSFAPLAANWNPRVGPGTLPAVVLAGTAARWAPRLAATLAWPRLLAASFAAGLAWLVTLATVDGRDGIGSILDISSEYLGTARRVTSIDTLLHEFVDRIPFSASPDNWPVHVAGHPPGALLFFVLLVRIGLGSGLAAGAVVTVLAATTPLAVLVTLRRLGAETHARHAAPFLVLGPAAVWAAVSADAMFAAVAAWGLCLLAVAATAAATSRRVGAALVAGFLLGYCAYLSYGLPLLGVLALAVLLVTRDGRPLPWTGFGAAVVVAAFTAAGFSWWRAYPVLHERYWAGAAHLRPNGYWVWADLAALCFSAGPVLGAALAVSAQRVRAREVGDARPLIMLSGAAALCIGLADASLMSKAEVERIWLPFVPWLLLGTALLPGRWRRRAFAGQLAFALAVQTLLHTRW